MHTRWDIIPKEKKIASGAVSGLRKDEFGSRFYQMIVQKMEVLPQVKDGNTVTEPSTPTVDKRKRKARDEHTEASQAKKANTSRDEDVDMEDVFTD